MNGKDGKACLSAEHKTPFQRPQHGRIFQLPQSYGNPTYAVTASKSGNRRNHKPIYAAARKLKPAPRGKNKPSDTGSNKQKRLAHARLQPPPWRAV